MIRSILKVETSQRITVLALVQHLRPYSPALNTQLVLRLTNRTQLAELIDELRQHLGCMPRRLLIGLPFF